MKKLHRKKTLRTVLNAGAHPPPPPPCEHQLTLSLSYIASRRCDADEWTVWMAEEPEKLGLLAEIEILKSAISCGKPLHDTPIPRLLGTAVHDARRPEQPRRESEEAAQAKDHVDSVEFWHSSSSALRTPAHSSLALALPCNGR